MAEGIRDRDAAKAVAKRHGERSVPTALTAAWSESLPKLVWDRLVALGRYDLRFRPVR